MKKIFLIISLILLLAACDSDSSINSFNCSQCNSSYQSCNETESKCQLLAGKCENSSDCRYEEICNSVTHQCEYQDPSKLCDSFDCGKNGVCIIDYDTPICICNDGYYWYENSCINPCESNPCVEPNKNICKSISVTDFSCSCNTGYQDSNGVCEFVSNNYCDPDIYSSAFGKKGSELKEELKTIVNRGFRTYGYEPAKRAMFSHVDNENGRVRCVYTGEYYSHPYQEDRELQTKTNENEFNCEHSWPQSYLTTSDAKADLHHLFPTFSRVNSKRSNYPFGIVGDGAETFGSGDYISKLKSNVFEPANQHKGNLARAMLYMEIKYNNPSGFIDLINQKATFKSWSTLDPIDDAERERNDIVETYQFNRNPFIDCPEFVDALFE